MGLFSFLTAAYDAGAFTNGNWVNIFFLIFYPLANIGMVVFHWFLSDDVYTWLKNAPYPDNERNALCVECKLPVVIDDAKADAAFSRCEMKRKRCENDKVDAKTLIDATTSFSKFANF